MFTSWNLKKVFSGEHLRVRSHGGDVDDRQSRIPGFCQKTLSSLTILAAGAGGLMSAIGEALARKGIGHLIITDEDRVEPSNLNRQKFYKRDIYKNKAHCLARNLAKESFLGSKVTGIALNFMGAVRSGLIAEYDGILCGIDDELAREEIAEYALTEQKPLITTAVSLDGDGGYVHVYKPGGGCWGCAFPRERRLRDDLANYRTPCGHSAAVKDILNVVSGAVVYALDCIFMERPIAWNYREFHLAGYMPDQAKRIERRADCQLCGREITGGEIHKNS